MSLKLWLGCALVAACGSDVTQGGMSVGLRTASNVDTAGIQGIKMFLYGSDCMARTCDDLLKLGRSPHDVASLGQAQETPYFMPGSYLHWVPTNFSSPCGVLYVEAYKSMGPGPVLAAGCTDVDPFPAHGSVGVMVDMISVNDVDMDGWIGQFNFPDNSHAQGPDCNDNDPFVFPGAPEEQCTGDRNCDGRSTCNRECQSNADCANKPGRACCSLAPNYVCQACSGSCASSLECANTHCCQYQINMCAAPGAGVKCACINTSECQVLGPYQCCVSNENTNPSFTPGTCGELMGSVRTEWCRCQTTAECLNLFPPPPSICCVRQRGTCDYPFVGETCLP